MVSGTKMSTLHPCAALFVLNWLGLKRKGGLFHWNWSLGPSCNMVSIRIHARFQAANYNQDVA